MRRVEQRSRFRRDYRRKSGGIYRPVIAVGGELWEVVDALAEDIRLPEAYHDHALHGGYEGAVSAMYGLICCWCIDMWVMTC